MLYEIFTLTQNMTPEGLQKRFALQYVTTTTMKRINIPTAFLCMLHKLTRYRSQDMIVIIVSDQINLV